MISSDIGEKMYELECDKRHVWPWFDNKNLEWGYWCKFISSSIYIIVSITSSFQIFLSYPLQGWKKKQIWSNNFSLLRFWFFFRILRSFIKYFFHLKHLLRHKVWISQISYPIDTIIQNSLNCELKSYTFNQI